MAPDECPIINTKLSKLEDAVTKLTDISVDLNKMLAVHEHRISSQEKFMNGVEDMLEKRRDEAELKLSDVYHTIREEDRRIIEEMHKLKEDILRQHEVLELKMGQIEKTIWTYLGGFAVLTFFIMYSPQILRFIEK